jgi:hypothetical protein
MRDLQGRVMPDQLDHHLKCPCALQHMTKSIHPGANYQIEQFPLRLGRKIHIILLLTYSVRITVALYPSHTRTLLSSFHSLG